MTRLFSILGDSISTFSGMHPAGFAAFYEGEACAATGVCRVEDTWWMHVVRHFGGEVLANASWSGSMVEGAGFPCGDSAGRIAALGAQWRVPDDVLVYFGTNDYGWGGPEAQAAGRAHAVPAALSEQGGIPAPATAGLAPDGAAKRFGGAYAHMLALVRERFPVARIWCFSLAPGRVRGSERSTFTYVFRGEPFAAYNRAIECASIQAGCAFCDLTALGWDYEAADGTHPTALGMRQLAWMMESAMARVEAASSRSAGTFPGGEAFRSTDPCVSPGRACVGCPYALATGNQWRHVCRAPERDVEGCSTIPVQN